MKKPEVLMLSKLLITIGIIFYGVAVPILEVNPTHVFDMTWTSHERLHEVWQLTTNSSIAVYCFWLVWVREKTQLPGILGLLVTGGFLLAYVIRSGYGGSMVLSDGSEKTVFGANLGLVGFGVVVILTIIAMVIDNRKTIITRGDTRSDET
jgi:hypothetical protein